MLSGCIATYLAFKGELRWAYWAIIIGAIFDFFDGLTARALNVSSPIGKELDSLADCVTFGFAPSAIVFYILKRIIPTSFPFLHLIPYMAFLIAAFSALRLAKFNLDERQTMGFIGLPTPANALFWGAFGWLMCPKFDLVLPIASIPDNMSFTLLLLCILTSCWLLVSEIPMFALKFKTYAFRANILRYSFIIFSIITLIILGFGAFFVIIPLYILTSIVSHKILK